MNPKTFSLCSSLVGAALVATTLSGFSEDQVTKTEDRQVMINKSIGVELFSGDASLWESDAAIVARRLGWPSESEGDLSSSYRYYPRKDYGFLNAHPYSATLYAADNKVAYFSIVFANKGDFNSSVGEAENHFKPVGTADKKTESLADAMKRDYKNIGDALTNALGDSTRQFYGEKTELNNVLRWDYKDHSFILSLEKGEFVRLLIVSKEVADARGKFKRMNDDELKVVIAKNVEKNEIGDVWVSNIPMVNQGPKGYCAPATFERAMRYMQVPADMYILASAATDPERGTNTELLSDIAKRQIISKGRRIKDVRLNSLAIRSVKKYIDKGVPVLWRMRSLEDYNKIANKRSIERRSLVSIEKATDEQIKAWADTLSEEADNVVDKLEKIQENHHICMIIGYNEKTNEFAVSDSWGRSYAIRWVHVDIAKAVTYGNGIIIIIEIFDMRFS